MIKPALPKTIVLLLFFAIAAACPLNGAEKKNHILIINSYNKGFPWTDSIVDTIEKTLVSSGIRYELHIEYMDTKRYSGNSWFGLLSGQYRYKYSNMKIDCIIATDDDALIMLEKFHDSLFPGTPVVFCGINDLGAPSRVNRKFFTGVMEEQSPAKTVDLMLKLHPGTKKIFVICDHTTTGKARAESMKQVIPLYSNISFIFSGDEPLDRTLNTISGLEEDTLVLVLAYFRDSEGINYTYENVMRSIFSISKRPVYSVSVNYLGYGTVGGVMNSPEVQGETAAGMCLRIITGITPGSIPVLSDIQNPVMIDYSAASHFRIREELYPEDTIFINRPYGFMNFYRANRVYVHTIISVALMVVVMVLAVSIFLLLRADRKRRKLVQDLKKALDRVNTLSGLLPICSSCHKIRDDNGEWHALDSYIGKHSKVEFTHSLCPVCASSLYPDMFNPDGTKK